MQAHVYEGYFENGRFYSKERQQIRIPERYRVNITLFNERVDKKEILISPEKRPFSDLFGEWSGQIWLVEALSKISSGIKERLVFPSSSVYLSSVSLWEIVIKTSLGKLVFKEGFNATLDSQRPF